MSDADQDTPSVARMYDYYLGGTNNLAVDREVADRILAMVPGIREVALANRRFLENSVRFMAESGVRQFLDLGAGMPTSPSVHEAVRQVCPDARVVYVDNDPVVIEHSRGAWDGLPGIVTIQHDLRQPSKILSDPALRGHLDLDQPVGVLFFAVLHFIPYEAGLGIVTSFRQAIAAGSHMAISVAVTGDVALIDLDQAEALYADSTAPVTGVRWGRTEIERLFDGFDLVEPGLVDVTGLRTGGSQGPIPALCGDGRKR